MKSSETTDYPQNANYTDFELFHYQSSYVSFQNTPLKENESKSYINNKFTFEILYGWTNLKLPKEVIGDYQSFFTDSEVEKEVQWFNQKSHNISMRMFAFRLGYRTYLLRKLPTKFEISFGRSKGNLFHSNNTYDTFSGPFNISKDLDITNTVIGGSFGLSLPLYIRKYPSSYVLSPEAILLDIKFGADMMIFRVNSNESGFDETGFTFSVSGEKSLDEWFFSYIGFGLEYMIFRYLIIKADTMIGAYPVSGPGEVRYGRVVSSGPPNVWGYNFILLFGFELLL